MDDESLVRHCVWCGSAYRLGSLGRRAVYCRRSCRQRAYEARREAERTADAVAAASASDPSRDEKARRRRRTGAAGSVPLPLWGDADAE